MKLLRKYGLSKANLVLGAVLGIVTIVVGLIVIGQTVDAMPSISDTTINTSIYTSINSIVTTTSLFVVVALALIAALVFAVFGGMA